MSELEHTLDLFTKYGVPLVITVLAIWVTIDLYQTAKKKWVPEFLSNFSVIANNVKGLNESVRTLSDVLAHQSPLFQLILDRQKEGFDIISHQIDKLNEKLLSRTN